MSTLSGDGAGTRAIRFEQDLLEIFRLGEKTADRFGIGIEYERLPILRDSGRAAPYAAPRRAGGGAASVEAFLEALESQDGWRAEREGGRIIALDRSGTRLTLEPGAQVELSGRVHRGLETARAELVDFVRATDAAAAPLGISFLGLGYHPISDVGEIAWVPKGRYQIMAPYLAGQGHLAHGMMKGTAGCQINLDYGSEGDAMEKLRVAMGVSSIVTALCANSPLSRGQANGFRTVRCHIWTHTDPDRCGLPPFALEEGSRYTDYLRYALDTPMLFVVRDGRWIDMTGRTFRAYLGGRSDGLSPTLADWELHLTTLFPEARLKSYVEVRGADSGSPEAVVAVAALWKGLLESDRARGRAWRMVADASHAERMAFHRDVARDGLAARLRGTPALELAQDLVRLASDSLGNAEAAYLEPLRRLAFVERACPADLLLARWSGAWGRDPRRLVAALCPEPPTPQAATGSPG